MDQAITPGSAENGGWILNPMTAVGSALSTDTKDAIKLRNYINSAPPLEPNKAFDWLKQGKTEEAKAAGEAINSWESNYINKTGAFIVMDRNLFSSNNDVERKEKLNKILVTSYKNQSSDKDYIQTGDDKYITTADPDAIGYILAANKAIKLGKTSTNLEIDLHSSSILDLHINSDLVMGLRSVYHPMKSINSNSSEIDKISAVSDGIQLASTDLPIATSVLTREGDAGIGTPLVFTAAEKNLKVEASLLRNYDIYWIQLAINPSEELISRSSELRYDITIETPNCLVLAVEPLRLGTEESTSSKASIPDIKVGDVEVGEMFSRTVEYKYIRPTILGHGIQTSSFGWIFSDEALDASAKKLFAVVGVPKHQKQITTKMSLAAKLKGFFGTSLESDWGSTGSTPYTVQLSP